MWDSDHKQGGAFVHKEPASAYLNSYESVLLAFGGNCGSGLSKSEENIHDCLRRSRARYNLKIEANVERLNHHFIDAKKVDMVICLSTDMGILRRS